MLAAEMEVAAEEGAGVVKAVGVGQLREHGDGLLEYGLAEEFRAVAGNGFAVALG